MAGGENEETHLKYRGVWERKRRKNGGEGKGAVGGRSGQQFYHLS